jgi:hypothetical protein
MEDGCEEESYVSVFVKGGDVLYILNIISAD